MERIALGAMCLIVPAAIIAVMLIGYGIFSALLRTVSPFEVWADAKIEEYEKMMTEDDNDDERKYSEDK